MPEQNPSDIDELLQRIDRDESISGAMLDRVAEAMDDCTQYKCCNYRLHCAGEDVLVIYDTEEQSFIQIEVPMGETGKATVTHPA